MLKYENVGIGMKYFSLKIALTFLTMFMSYSIANANEMTCDELLRYYEKQTGVKAFAASPDRKYCGMSRRWGDQDTAKRVALKYCKESYGRDGCKIIKVSGLVNEPLSSVCKKDYQNWRKKRGAKAFAISLNGLGCSNTFEWNNLNAAKVAALKNCETKNPKCKIYKANR